MIVLRWVPVRFISVAEPIASGRLGDEDRDQESHTDPLAGRQADAERHLLGHAVEERPQG